MTTTYILIRRGPLGAVMAHDLAFDTPEEAGQAAAQVLRDQPGVTGEAAVNYGRELAALPLGTITTHSTGYAFRILAADYTANGRLIRPGLRVLNNDLRGGTVAQAQFMKTGSNDPGGEFFINWYDIDVDGVGKQQFNGERLTTNFLAFKKTDVPRETSLALGEGW